MAGLHNFIDSVQHSLASAISMCGAIPYPTPLLMEPLNMLQQQLVFFIDEPGQLRDAYALEQLYQALEDGNARLVQLQLDAADGTLPTAHAHSIDAAREAHRGMVALLVEMHGAIRSMTHDRKTDQ